MLGIETAWGWAIAFWLVMGIALIVCLLAAMVVSVDLVRDRDPRRTEIRERLEQLEQNHGRKTATRVDETRVTDITTRRVGGA
jgi:predicted MFS family arabinose efflux permease